jgi:uncharacterized RDD family membrane protein YckC
MGNATPWYYLDAARERHGPVTAEVVAARFRDGTIDAQSLVWREGLSEWTPLGQLREELDLPTEPAPVAAAASAATVATSAIEASQPASAAPAGAAAEPVVAAAAAPAAAASSVYSPPRSRITEDEGPIDTQDVVQAGFLRRWVALFVDILILSSVYYAAFFALLMLGFGLRAGMGGRDFEAAMGGITLLAYPLYFLFASIYYAGFEASSMQATPGKLVLGIKVVDREGRRLSPAHALGRWVAASLSYLTVYVGFLMAAFTERKQALHDIVAGTQVVDRWAYTSQPEKQQRGTHGCVVAFAAVMGALMAIALLAIAVSGVSAYREYGQRALRSVESPLLSQDTSRPDPALTRFAFTPAA